MTRLHEIELGSADPLASRHFYQTILRLQPAVVQDGLTVFGSGNEGVDFNTSNHLLSTQTVVSFLTNDLQAVMDRLVAEGVPFNGPTASHLGMHTVEFTDPDGNRVRVNEATADSPEWLTA